MIGVVVFGAMFTLCSLTESLKVRKLKAGTKTIPA